MSSSTKRAMLSGVATGDNVNSVASKSTFRYKNTAILFVPIEVTTLISNIEFPTGPNHHDTLSTGVNFFTKKLKKTKERIDCVIQCLVLKKLRFTNLCDVRKNIYHILTFNLFLLQLLLLQTQKC